MRAVVLEKTGGPELLTLRDWPEPEPRANEVIVRVRAAGVCGRDLIDRVGGFPAMKLPTILGHEFAGEVVSVGVDARGFQPGDRVVNLHRPFCGECPSCYAGDSVECERAWQSFGHTVDGAYAELVAAHHRSLVHLPDGIEFLAGASLGCTAAVALRALREVGHVELGETVLVTGASGGVGSAGIQIARLMGARVVAVTSSPDKIADLEKLGAHHVVVIENGGFASRVRELLGGGVEVVLECTGAATFRDALKCLRPRGRLIVVGNITLEKVSINLGAVILYSHRIAGSRSYSRRDLEDCFAALSSGTLSMLVDRTLPLSEAAQAHELLAARKVKGRVILVP